MWAFVISEAGQQCSGIFLPSDFTLWIWAPCVQDKDLLMVNLKILLFDFDLEIWIKQHPWRCSWPSRGLPTWRQFDLSDWLVLPYFPTSQYSEIPPTNRHGEIFQYLGRRSTDNFPNTWKNTRKSRPLYYLLYYHHITWYLHYILIWSNFFKIRFL